MSKSRVPKATKSVSASEKQITMEHVVQSLRNMEVKSKRAQYEEKFTERPNMHTDLHFHASPAFETEKDCEWAWQMETITDLNVSIAQRTKELVYREGLLIALAIEDLADGTFESGWQELALKRKKEYALEGLYRGSCCSPRDNNRAICPELTINGLVGDSEYNLMNLLKRIVAHDPTSHRRVKELFIFVHPYITDEYRHSDDAPDLLKKLDKLIDSSQWREQKPNVVHGCYKCLKTTDPAGLKRCARCQTIWYCSSACQKKDWSDHKKFCGKQHLDPKLLAPTPQGPDEFIGCPAPPDGI
ncbi:hypothetical protein B0H10DRAFT_2238679 [Mycena sp. CBHHK59/15]|nr:hypothetical protein B0H10DRAFT_2238679 [Mycena sp. CBHHK59/15]